MDEQRQDDQLESIYNSSVPIQNIALTTSRDEWTIGTGSKRERERERESGRSVLAARQDDDNVASFYCCFLFVLELFMLILFLQISLCFFFCIFFDSRNCFYLHKFQCWRISSSLDTLVMSSLKYVALDIRN